MPRLKVMLKSTCPIEQACKQSMFHKNILLTKIITYPHSLHSYLKVFKLYSKKIILLNKIKHCTLLVLLNLIRQKKENLE